MRYSRLDLFFLALLSVTCMSVVAQAQIQFDRPKTEPPLDNPYTLNVPREQILEGVREVLRTCEIKIDEVLSKPREGKLVTLPVVFTKGVTTRTDLEYLATLPADEVRNWTQGRFVLEISVTPVDQKRSQLFVYARIEGRVADAFEGNKWVAAQSNGRLEDEVIRGMAGKILGIDLSVKKSSQRPSRRILNCEY
ncbi:MAG: hypothetical protein L0226_02610 [Acidobacteria bacterium]|nr:hypothetical protein [Acidobacteriota bacterium]